MSTFAATVSELIEILQQYPGDWPVMIPNQETDDQPSVFSGLFVYEGEARQAMGYFYEFYECGHVPDGKPTIPALLLGDWEGGDK